MMMTIWEVMGFPSQGEFDRYQVYLGEMKADGLKIKKIVADARAAQKPGEPLYVDLRLLDEEEKHALFSHR